MVGSGATGADGIPLFHVHPGHAFEGFELVERPGCPALLVARCDCGEVLDVADARLADCPDCRGRDRACRRCGGSGHVVEHAALHWRPAEPS
jgi:hypothetical protein